MSSAGRFEQPGPDAPFVIRSSYFELRRYADPVERDGRRMTFHGVHRPLADYTAAISDAGLLVDRLVEVRDPGAAPDSRWRRVPLFLQLRAIKIGASAL